VEEWQNIAEDEIARRIERIKRAGFDAIMVTVYDSQKAFYSSHHLPVSEPFLEKLLPIAKSFNLEVHAWIWSMICNIEQIHEKNPHWFAINRNGESTIHKPAYVDHYRFMCPNQPEVREFVSTTVAELADYSELDGVHLDYIRYPDVILGKNLQKKYGIVQDREYPEYDYCYCEACRKKFKDLSGVDIGRSQNADEDTAWREFRYDSIVDLVNDSLVPQARKKGKAITAAVFPNWKDVRQQWFRWNVDGVFPMLYHDFYSEDLEWVKGVIQDGKQRLGSECGLYSGLFVSSFNPNALTEAMEESMLAGADGISLFEYKMLNEEHWKVVSQL
jgi:uncharacterized lipoprotein YddW (UPF0748 family)